MSFVEFILKISGYSMKLFSLAEFSTGIKSNTVGSNIFYLVVTKAV